MQPGDIEAICIDSRPSDAINVARACQVCYLGVTRFPQFIAFEMWLNSLSLWFSVSQTEES